MGCGVVARQDGSRSARHVSNAAGVSAATTSMSAWPSTRYVHSALSMRRKEFSSAEYVRGVAAL